MWVEPASLPRQNGSGAHVFVCGMAALDLVFQVDDFQSETGKQRARESTIGWGGCGANAAVAIRRLGGNASLAAHLGADSIGDLVLASLSAQGVFLDQVHRIEGARSPFSSIYVRGDGERQIVSFRDEPLFGHPRFGYLPESCGGVLADTRWMAGLQRAIQLARVKDIPSIIDAEAPAELVELSGASHIAFSRSGLSRISGTHDLQTALRVRTR